MTTPAFASFRSILLVEDNLHDIELTMTALEGNHVLNPLVVVRSGEEALDFLYQRGTFTDRAPGHPVVVLLDLKMPGMNGLDLLQRIKSEAAFNAVPVVMLTTSRNDTDLNRAYELGANAYVVKPVDFSEFTAAIRQVGSFWGVLNEQPGV